MELCKTIRRAFSHVRACYRNVQIQFVTLLTPLLNLWQRTKLSPRFSPLLHLPKHPFFGTFRQYLAAVANHPAYAETAQQRLLRLIDRQGINYTETLRLRHRTGDGSQFVYNAFAGLNIDPLLLSNFMLALRTKLDGNLLLLSGLDRGAQVALVSRLKKLLAESEPIPVLRLPTAGLNLDPLRLLFALPAFVARQSFDVIDDYLEALGMDKIFIARSGDREVRHLCYDSGVPPVWGIATTLSARNLMPVLLAALRVQRDSTRLKPRESELLLAAFESPDDAVVESVSAADCFAGFDGAPDFDSWIGLGADCELSLLELHWLEGDRRAPAFCGKAHASSAGMLVVQDYCSFRSRYRAVFEKLAMGEIPLARGCLHWQGVMIGLTEEAPAHGFPPCLLVTAGGNRPLNGTGLRLLHESGAALREMIDKLEDVCHRWDVLFYQGRREVAPEVLAGTFAELEQVLRECAASPIAQFTGFINEEVEELQSLLRRAQNYCFLKSNE